MFDDFYLFSFKEVIINSKSSLCTAPELTKSYSIVKNITHKKIKDCIIIILLYEKHACVIKLRLLS